jgi:hypothetical protein
MATGLTALLVWCLLGLESNVPMVHMEYALVAILFIAIDMGAGWLAVALFTLEIVASIRAHR